MNNKLVSLMLMLKRDGKKRAEFLKRNKIFYKIGENCYFHPIKIPSEPYLVSMHNNVVVAADVKFITHDILSAMFSNAPKFKDKGKYKIYLGKIEILDNVCIGANSTILYNVKIGPNAIVAAGSVVTKDVQEGTIVGGNPAKVIGYVEDLVEKRVNNLDTPSWLDNITKITDYYWKEI